MPKPTIKSLQDQLDTVRELRQGDMAHIRNQNAELERLRGRMSDASAEVERLRKDVQWHKQVIQMLMERR